MSTQSQSFIKEYIQVTDKVRQYQKDISLGKINSDASQYLAAMAHRGDLSVSMDIMVNSDYLKQRIYWLRQCLELIKTDLDSINASALKVDLFQGRSGGQNVFSIVAEFMYQSILEGINVNPIKLRKTTVKPCVTAIELKGVIQFYLDQIGCIDMNTIGIDRVYDCIYYNNIILKEKKIDKYI